MGNNQQSHSSRFGTWQGFVLSFLVLAVHAQQPFLPVETARALSGAEGNTLEKRQGCISNFFSCSGVGAAFNDVCCQYGYTCALDQSSQPACCPVKYVKKQHRSCLDSVPKMLGGDGNPHILLTFYTSHFTPQEKKLTNIISAPSVPAPPPPASPLPARPHRSPSSSTLTSPSPMSPRIFQMPSSARQPSASAAPTTLPAATSWTV